MKTSLSSSRYEAETMSALKLTRDIIQSKWNQRSNTCATAIIKSALSTKSFVIYKLIVNTCIKFSENTFNRFKVMEVIPIYV